MCEDEEEEEQHSYLLEVLLEVYMHTHDES
jgi:hypothetical protein